jgi:hypothetical protein
MSDDLRALIASAAAEANPEFISDNPETAVDPEAATDEYVTDDTPSEVVEETEEETPVEEVTDSEEDTEEAGTDSEKYAVKVDGEVFEVTLDELKSGYQRQADYTREKQALKAEVEQFAASKEEFTDQLGALEELDTAWEENPVTVLAHFASNTANPTQSVAMLIRELAASNLLEPQFLEMFGITPDIQKEWARDNELNTLRSANEKGLSAKDKALEEATQELEIQRAIAEYDAQIDDIIDAEGLDFTVKQRNAFRQELASYAAENELTNLKAAYKAFKYEETQKKKVLAEKTVAKAKQKKATSVVSRSGAAGEGAPLQDTTDLNAVIRAAMKDATAS